MQRTESGAPATASDKVICGAKTRSGKVCKNPPVNGRNRCRMHGGMTPRGINHYNYQGKGRSRDIPAHLVADYHRAISDEELHTLTHELALFKARFDEQVRRLSSGESRGFIALLNEAADGLEAAARSGDAEKLRDALANVVGLIRRAGNYESAWQDLSETTEKVAKLAQAEHKRRRDEKLLLPVEHANMMIGVLANIVRDEVKDKAVLRKISQRFAATLHRGAPVGVESSGGSVGATRESPAADTAQQQQSLPPNQSRGAVIDVDVSEVRDKGTQNNE